MPDRQAEFERFDQREFIEALRRRGQWLPVGLALGLALGSVIARIVPPVYWSEATLLVESPWFPQGFLPNPLGTPIRDRLQSLEHRLTSDVAVEAVARMAGLERLGGDVGAATAAIRKGFELEIADAASADSAVIQIGFRSADATLARDVVRSVSQYAIDQSREESARQSAATAEVLREELERVGRELNEKYEQLSRLAAQPGAAITSGAESEGLRAARQAEIEALRGLETEVARAEARYTAKHPNLLQLRSELARQRMLLRAPPRSAPRISASVESDLKYRSLLREYESGLTSYESLLARETDAAMAVTLGRTGALPEIRILRAAGVPRRPVTQLQFFLGGALVGLAIATVLALWQTLFRPTFARIESLEETTGLPVIAALPRLGTTRLASVPRLVSPDSAAGEQFQRVLHYLRRSETAPVVLVTSAQDGAGTSWCAANLSAAATSGGQRRVLLIDANLRHESSSALLGLPVGAGLVECVRGDISLSTAVMPTSVPQLSVLRAGVTSNAALASLDDERFEKLIEQARREFSAVFIDTPPRTAFVDSSLVERVATLCLCVVEADRTPRASLRRALRDISLPVGLVFNRMDARAYSNYFGQKPDRPRLDRTQ